MSAHLISEAGRPDGVAAPLDLPEGLPSRVHGWVSQVACLTGPETVRWCDGSPAETHTLYTALVALEASQETADELAEPMSAASSATTASRARSAARRRATAVTGDMPSVDSVRAHPEAQRRTLLRLFAGCMRGRVMYAVPYATPDEAWRLGIELTDSPWVVLNLGLATRVGVPALRRIRQGHRWSASVHSVGYPLLDETGTRRPDVPWPCNAEKWIARFPETGDVWSFGTGFGAARLADCTA